LSLFLTGGISLGSPGFHRRCEGECWVSCLSISVRAFRAIPAGSRKNRANHQITDGWLSLFYPNRLRLPGKKTSALLLTRSQPETASWMKADYTNLNALAIASLSFRGMPVFSATLFHWLTPFFTAWTISPAFSADNRKYGATSIATSRF
jgi:hypothetical protein